MIWLYLIFFLFFSLFSFSQLDLNLTLYSWPIINPLKTFIQNLGFYNRPLTTLIFFILIILFFFTYIHLAFKSKFKPWLFLVLLIGFSFWAYPMFSYDIFNYLFNAKMVLIYHVNPHIQTAIQFSADPILRFMRNVHTPAPYAYGWTGISLIPGLTWFTQNFTLSFWAMKLFISFFWLMQLWILKKLINQLFPKETWRWWLFALNPLVIIETLVNGHNDVVMMFLTLFSYWFFINSKKINSIILLILSASIKYVTIILLPFYFLKKKIDLPSLFSFLLFLVLFTRPDQLHSWYLIWGFSFAVLSKSKQLLKAFVALSLWGLLRYLPFLYFGNWDPPVNLYRWLLLLIPLIIFIIPRPPYGKKHKI